MYTLVVVILALKSRKNHRYYLGFPVALVAEIAGCVARVQGIYTLYVRKNVPFP
jgi:hypothetical protein